MKQYVAPGNFRLVGKGWEIRRQLRQMTAAAPQDLLLTRYTAELPPIKVMLGGQSIVQTKSVTSEPLPAG